MRKKLLVCIIAVVCFCATCIVACTEPHEHDYTAATVDATCTENGKITYTCGCGESYEDEIPALGHDEETHEAKAPNCTEVGWEEYVTCKREGCNYTTYVEEAALEHDVETHEAQEATCTEIGWEEYVTCKREGCNYTTYVEEAALEHDVETHEAQEATCTEIGWEEYVTCRREGCDYTTYVEIPVPSVTLGLMIIVDTSGSMLMTDASGVRYIDRAIDGAIAALNLLDEEDYVGLMTLDDSEHIILPLTSCANKTQILDAFDSVNDANGSTIFTGAIERAGQSLRALQGVDRRHILLISDGLPGDPPRNYEPFIRQFREQDGITFSMAILGQNGYPLKTAGKDYKEADLTDEVIKNDPYKKMLRAVVIGGGYLYFTQRNEISKIEEFVLEDVKRVNSFEHKWVEENGKMTCSVCQQEKSSDEQGTE